MSNPFNKICMECLGKANPQCPKCQGISRRIFTKEEQFSEQRRADEAWNFETWNRPKYYWKELE